MVATRGIVLKTIKYGDTSIIAVIYTEMSGLQSYLLKGIRTASKQKMSIYQPLSLIEIVASNKNSNSLQYIKEAKLYYNYISAQTDIRKCSIMIFLAEVLQKCLKTQESDKILFQFICEALISFDQCTGNFNDFHLLFMLNLSKHLGFYPKNQENTKFQYFDLVNAEFVQYHPGHNNIILPNISSHFSQLIERPFNKEYFGLSNFQIRKELLAAIILFFNIHIPNFDPIHSFHVLHDVLNN